MRRNAGSGSISLSHGSGGLLMHRLIDSLFIRRLRNEILSEKKDSAILSVGNKKLAFTTDSYVVKPIFFPGGDIGSLAVFGTANDLAVCGARPLYMSLGLVIEEGLENSVLEKIILSIRKAAKVCAVKIVTGDTKVVEKSSCDKIFINTSGIGEVYYPGLSVKRITPGDVVIVSGPIGEHAVSVLSKREGIDFKTKVKSDSASLCRIIKKTLSVSANVKFMRDPTRGGLATTLNEMVADVSIGIAIDEEKIPITEGVREACELLGFDPLYLACEGVFVLILPREGARIAMKTMKKDSLGRFAEIVGVVTKENKGKVLLNTASGGQRILDMLTGEQLPRIC